MEGLEGWKQTGARANKELRKLSKDTHKALCFGGTHPVIQYQGAAVLKCGGWGSELNISQQCAKAAEDLDSNRAVLERAKPVDGVI